jgi:hypothetical protein
VQGRSPTCYSPVRHSCTPKGLTVRLACVKHAASVRPEPESNSPNKNNPCKTQVNSNQNKPDLTKRHQKLASKKQQTTTCDQRKTGSPPTQMAQKQQTKTTKHTIEFSNNRLLCTSVPVSGQPCQLNLSAAVKSSPGSSRSLELLTGLRRASWNSLDPDYLCAQTRQVLDEERVAPIDVKNVVDLGFSVCDEAGKNQPGAGPNVRGPHRCAR